MATNATQTLPSVTIQNVVYTAKRFGQAPSITYSNIVLAGHETVSVDSSFNITIGIQSGTTTMTQIKTAIDASRTTDGSFAASDLVSVNVSTHGADTATSFVSVPLTGGLAVATKATLNVGPMLLTAVSSGTGGNSIRFKFTSGATAGSEIVTVSTNDISVQIADTVITANTTSAPGSETIVGSTYAQIAAAILASTDAHALVLCSSNNHGSLNDYANVSQMPSYTSLAGGAATSVATTGAIQGITVVTAANGPTLGTITLSDGATAGAEVVTVTGINVVCQCQIGTSTVTQIVTALQGAAPFTALYTASGSASTHPVSVYQVGMTGAVNGGGYGFYVDNTVTALTSTFVYFPFLNTMQDLLVENRDPSGNNTVIFSFDGINNHGVLSATQSRQVFKLNKPGIYMKYGTGAPAYRCSAI